MAQFWAAGCEYEENEMRHSQSTQFDYVGESLAATASYTVNYTQLIGQEWFRERIYFNYYTSTCVNVNGNGNNDGNYEACGRYTQVSMRCYMCHIVSEYGQHAPVPGPLLQMPEVVV